MDRRTCFSGGEMAILVNFPGDNQGPYPYEMVKDIYADLHKRYPNAQLIASSFNEIVEELLAIKDDKRIYIEILTEMYKQC